MDESTPWVKITREELYLKFHFLQNLSIKDMLILVNMCFDTKSDGDLIYAVKCYMHSYPELQKPENFTKIYKVSEND